eukprot:scaffold52467_cov30-Tisochrysis_lutea.AAC.2
MDWWCCGVARSTTFQSYCPSGPQVTKHPTEVKGLRVEPIIRSGLRTFTDEAGHLWCALADYFIRQALFEQARDVYEEGIASVLTVRAPPST